MEVVTQLLIATVETALSTCGLVLIPDIPGSRRFVPPHVNTAPHLPQFMVNGHPGAHGELVLSLATQGPKEEQEPAPILLHQMEGVVVQEQSVRLKLVIRDHVVHQVVPTQTDIQTVLNGKILTAQVGNMFLG